MRDTNKSGLVPRENLNFLARKAGSSSSAGFTLVELLVVLAIIIILSGVVVFNINSEQQNSALFRSAQNLSLNLRQAQNYALASKILVSGSVPCGWGVHFNGVNSTSYIIFADLALNQNCSDRDFVRAADGSEDFETINFESGIKISILSSNLSDVVFTPPDPIVNFTPAQTSASITLINKNSTTRVITVNKAGLISSP